MSLSPYYLEYGRHAARPRRRAYAPMNNTACHDNYEKIHLSYMSMGLRLAAFWAAGAPLIKFCCCWNVPFCVSRPTNLW